LIPRLGCPRSPGQPRVPARPGPPYRPRPVPPSRLLPRARPARPPGRRGPPRPGRQLCQWRLHLANGSGGGRSWSLAGDLPFRARWSPWRRAHGHVTAGGTGVALLLPRSRAGATLRCRTVCVRAITSNRTAPGESDPHPVPVSGGTTRSTTLQLGDAAARDHPLHRLARQLRNALVVGVVM